MFTLQRRQILSTAAALTRLACGRAVLAAVLLTLLALVVVFGPVAYVVANLVTSLERLAEVGVHQPEQL